MGRQIKWTFDGGEPLDMDDIVTLLKLCRTNGAYMKLNTNGGKLWMDWWAIEPYVDDLVLTYHYWQNPNLINYIVQTFQKANKPFKLNVPIRPDFFDEDMARAQSLEEQANIKVTRAALYKYANQSAGMFEYSRDQLYLMSGVKPPPIVPPAPIPAKPAEPAPPPAPIPTPAPVPIKPPPSAPPLVQQQHIEQTTTWTERNKIIVNPTFVFTGQLCNVGIERLMISHTGWVSGSECNNQPLGNIWHDGWTPPSGPQVCTMQTCSSLSDRKITKFPAPVQ